MIKNEKEETFNKFKSLIKNNKDYIEKCEKIINKAGDLVPFKLNKAQVILDDIISELEKKGKPVRIIILKARQLGLSTYSEGYIFKKTATQKNKKGTIIAHEDKASQNLYNMYKLFYDELPEILQPMIRRSNAQEMLFENPSSDPIEKKKNPGLRSKIAVSTAKNVNTGRSATIHYLHASEVAFWDDASTLMLGLLQCVPRLKNTSVIIESTANGVGGYFYETWELAEKGENDFVPVFLPWFIDDEYSISFDTESDKIGFKKTLSEYELWLIKEFKLTLEQLNWRRWCIKNNCKNDEEKFMQEYPSTPEEAFITSGRPVFDSKALREYKTAVKKPKIGFLDDTSGVIQFIENPKGYVKIYNFPEQNKFYSIGADVAEGLIDGDYSAAMLGSNDLNIDAIWHGHIDPDLYGYELVKLAKFYNDAYIGVESNNHGLTTLKSILHHEYYNVYYQKTYDKITDKVTQKLGWNTNPKTKPLMIDKLAQYVREKWLGLYDKELNKELFTYVKDEKGRTNAQEGSHDDLVMSLAIWLQLILEGNYLSTPAEIPKDKVNSYKKKHLFDRRDYDVDLDSSEKPEIAE